VIDHESYSQQYINSYENLSFETVLVKARREQVLTSLRKYVHRRILEIGCGLEPVFQFCDAYDSYTVVESSEEFASRAEALSREQRNVEILRGNFEDTFQRLLGDRFDFIILSSLLHEVPDPARLLQAVNQVCGENTVTHINVPNVNSFHRLLAYEMRLIDSVFQPSEMETRFQRHTRFDKQLLLRIVQENGFSVLSFGTYFIKPFTNQQMDDLLKSGILERSVIEGLQRIAKYMPELGCEMYVEAQKVRKGHRTAPMMPR
jgi:SAM-dependent methyltransferase